MSIQAATEILGNKVRELEEMGEKMHFGKFETIY